MKLVLGIGLILSTILMNVYGGGLGDMLTKEGLGPVIEVNQQDQVEEFYLDKCRLLIKDEVDKENRRGHTIVLEKVSKQTDKHGTVYDCHFTAHGASSKGCQAFVYFDLNGKEPTMNKSPCLTSPP